MARARADDLRRRAPFSTFVGRLLGFPTDAGAFGVGAAGEIAVGRRLGKRRAPRWRILHAVPLGDGGVDIDHVVIGPPGVFTLNSKHHPTSRIWVGTHAFVVNGHKTDYLWRSRAEGARATRLLGAASAIPVGVHPVIVVAARRLDVRQQPPGVHVVDAGAVVRWLRHQQPVLTAEEVTAIFDVARRDSTWLARHRD